MGQISISDSAENRPSPVLSPRPDKIAAVTLRAEPSSGPKRVNDPDTIVVLVMMEIFTKQRGAA